MTRASASRFPASVLGSGAAKNIFGNTTLPWQKAVALADADGGKEFALLGTDPDWLKLLSEILRAHGFPCRAFSDLEELESWLKGEGSGCAMLIAETDSEGLVSSWLRELRTGVPDLRLLPDLSHFRPSEIYRLIGTLHPVSEGA
jgi:hypothetical protein